MAASTKKNEFLTFRDPDGYMRGLIDKLRIRESEGMSIPPDRTTMLRLCLERCLKKEKPKTKT